MEEDFLKRRENSDWWLKKEGAEQDADGVLRVTEEQIKEAREEMKGKDSN